jgi:hypothetical protein
VRGLDDGPDIALDLCVSDCGTGKVSPNYQSGSKCEAKSKEKKRKYNSRFSGIPAAELCCPGYGRTGSRSSEAVTLQKRITKAIAAADVTVPFSLVSSRVNQVLSVALQKAIASNVLDFRYTKLAKARLVGGGSFGVGNALPVAQLSPGQLLQQATNDWDDADDET